MKLVAFETEDLEAAALRGLSPPHQLVCTPDPLTNAPAPSSADAEIVTAFLPSDLSGAADHPVDSREYPRIRRGRAA